MNVEPLLLALSLVAVLGCGLIAGVFFAFSSFVMKALARLGGGEGMAAMQSINVVVLNPVFLGSFVGTAVICLLSLVTALVGWGQPGSGYAVVGALLYLVGCFLVTGVFNVPRNDALAALTTQHDDWERGWQDYLRTWTAWNHVRTVASLAAAAMFALALMQGQGA